MSALRICEVIKTLNVGGAEVLLTTRLRLAHKAAREYTVICLYASQPELVESLTAAGVTVVDLTGYHPWTRYARLILMVIRQRPHIVNMHSPAPAAILRLALRLMRRGTWLVSTVHHTRYRLLTTIADRLTRGMDHRTVAVSPAVARSSAVSGARWLQVRIHGVDRAEQQQWALQRERIRAEFEIPENAFALITVANYRWDKNHRLLVEAAETVLRNRPDVLLLLAGSGPLQDQTVAEINRRRLAQQIRVLGSVQQAGRLIAAGDLLVLSSRYEGLPVVVMEALACGVPVVAPAVGGLPDLVSSGVNGILSEPGSAIALAEAITAAMDPETNRRLRQGARESADLVDIAATVSWFDDLYAGLALETSVPSQAVSEKVRTRI